MGGVWFIHDKKALFWQKRFPENVQKCPVIFKNLQGEKTNSDLKSSTKVPPTHYFGRTHCRTRRNGAHPLCDNTPSVAWRGVAWRDKGSMTTTKSAGYLLPIVAPISKEFEQKCNHRISHIIGGVI
jgi:hypothetical protein